MSHNYPNFICDNCGLRYGKWYIGGVYNGPKHHCATYHYGNCDLCNSSNVSVTEPRDFGYLVEWSVTENTDCEYSNSC